MQTTQRQYQLHASGEAPAALRLVDAPVKQPGKTEVLVRMRAMSLNRRDIYVQRGQYPGPRRPVLVPLSDGVGEVVETGGGVTRFKAGQRVSGIFFPQWLDGRPKPADMLTALGGAVDGMLSEFVTLDENALVAVPDYLSNEEAATLPCAGVTAWNALVTRGHTQPGDYVLLQGTGGVSIFGLQLTLALGGLPIITSSDDEKLAHARQLGAAATINYRSSPDWEKAAMIASGGGVQQALEVGGVDTLAKTLASMNQGGHIAVIGGLSKFGGDIPGPSLMGRNLTASGIYVGSRANFEALNAFLTRNSFKPHVGKVFEFADAAAAYAWMDSPRLFGKVVIRV